MSVLVKSIRGESSIRRLRPRSSFRAAGRAEERAGAPAPTPTKNHRRRELGPLQDQALYTCQCGFVFEATVSTSVGCPHCGTTQAW